MVISLKIEKYYKTQCKQRAINKVSQFGLLKCIVKFDLNEWMNEFFLMTS